MATSTSLYEEWKTLSKGRPLKIVTSGQGGSGKSTLINNFLGFSTWEGAKTGKSGKPVTTVVRQYTKELKGVKVLIFDTPDLYDPRIPTEKTLQDIGEVTGGEVDLLYYCISMRIARLNESDLKVLKLLYELFGKVLWENTVFLLTFANSESCNDYYQELFQNLTEETGTILELAGVPKKEAQSITVIDVGDSNPHLMYCDGTKKNWKEDLFVQSLRMAKPEAIPALLLIKLSNEEYEMLFNEEGRQQSVGEHWGNIARTVGSVVGGVVGASVGVALSGASLGLASSLTPGLMAGGFVAGEGIGQRVGKWWVDKRMQEVYHIVALKHQIWIKQRH